MSNKLIDLLILTSCIGLLLFSFFFLFPFVSHGAGFCLIDEKTMQITGVHEPPDGTFRKEPIHGDKKIVGYYPKDTRKKVLVSGTTDEYMAVKTGTVQAPRYEDEIVGYRDVPNTKRITEEYTVVETTPRVIDYVSLFKHQGQLLVYTPNDLPGCLAVDLGSVYESALVGNALGVKILGCFLEVKKGKKVFVPDEEGGQWQYEWIKASTWLKAMPRPKILAVRPIVSYMGVDLNVPTPAMLEKLPP